jgi:hypothetical protein
MAENAPEQFASGIIFGDERVGQTATRHHPSTSPIKYCRLLRPSWYNRKEHAEESGAD